MDRWSIGILLALIAIGGIALYVSPKPLMHLQDATSLVQTSPDSIEIIPGTPSIAYTDASFKFTIVHPVSALMQTSGFEGYLPTTQTPVVGFALPESLFAGTNLGDAGVYIGATSSPRVVATCTNPSSADGETLVGDMVVDGAAFKITISTGVGAGNIYDATSYRTVREGTCFEVVELLHSSNIANYTPGTVTQFDRQKISAMLDLMTQTFVFTR